MKPAKGSLLEKAIAIAVGAHFGQKDKFGVPYILHPLRMMCRLDSEAEKIVAILHDVVEDTQWTFEDLKREGFPDKIIQALDCVTKREGEAYEDFVKRSARNPLARRVKLADLEDNMDLRRLKGVAPKDAKRLAKYLAAWRQLHDIRV
jgi:(p)ppGpp synthase/HD superfamily hydrolase